LNASAARARDKAPPPATNPPPRTKLRYVRSSGGALADEALVHYTPEVHGESQRNNVISSQGVRGEAIISRGTWISAARWQQLHLLRLRQSHLPLAIRPAWLGSLADTQIASSRPASWVVNTAIQALIPGWLSNALYTFIDTASDVRLTPSLYEIH